MSRVEYRRGAHVFDSWWPFRVGVVIKRGKSTAHVRWSDGEVWKYDRDHMQFLRASTGGGNNG